MAKAPAKPKSKAKAEKTEAPKDVGGRPRIIDSPEQMQELADAYFIDREAMGKPPTMAGLCYALGFSERHALSAYEKYDGFSTTVKRLRLRVEQDRSEQLVMKDTFSPGQIFDLKNNHGWQDKSEVVVTGNLSAMLAQRRKKTSDA